MQKKALVIINQHTAKLKLRVDLLELLDIITKGGYACVARPTQKPGDAARYTALNADKFDAVICVGGDGTLNEVVSGLCTLPKGKRPPVGYIPAGTTNDFAASVGLPCDPLEAARFIVGADAAYLDCGRMRSASGDSCFNYIASFGAFTEVSYGTPQPLKNLFGHFAYVLESAKHLTDIKPCHMRFTPYEPETGESVIEDDFAFGAFANTLSIGGVIRLDPAEVAFDDGLHEYLLIRMPKNIAELNEAATELAALQNPSRRGNAKRVVYGRFSSGMIDAGEISWSLDGECVKTSGRIAIENLHSAYRLYSKTKPERTDNK